MYGQFTGGAGYTGVHLYYPKPWLPPSTSGVRKFRQFRLAGDGGGGAEWSGAQG